MPGRPRKPTNLKSISGTIRPHRERDQQPAVIPPMEQVPPAPDWLPNAYAVKEWRRLAAILTANRLLTEGMTSALGMLCALHGRLVQIWAAGATPQGSMIAIYRSMANDFGLPPVALGKMRPGGGEPAGNRFSNNGRRTK